MFRRVVSVLPPDPHFPANLGELGYKVNERDEIVSVKNPTEGYRFFNNRNERYNEVNREAINTCIRNEVLARLAALDVPTIPLPLGTPSTSPHIPILASADLKSRSRVILILNEASQDLGIWAYRSIGSLDANGGLVNGSAISFVQHLLRLPSSPTDSSPPGIIIANIGQLLWYRGGKKAVSFQTWNALPRKSAVHGPMKIDDVKNRVDKNESVQKHVAYVFEEVLGSLVKKEALVDVVGLSNGGYSSKISAIALGNPLHSASEITNPAFAAFLKAVSSTPLLRPCLLTAKLRLAYLRFQRGRAYICDSEPVGTLLPDPHLSTRSEPGAKSDLAQAFSSDSKVEIMTFGDPLMSSESSADSSSFGCPIFASGEWAYSECIMSAAYKEICAFFDEVASKGDEYVNVEILPAKAEEDREEVSLT
ncbi:MAG: hypothetical protein M1817_003854 [Caeruleum heppii]|nr:MAG: hypothetical protein M1817_003854 [Caeruleum heppii]